MRDRRQTRSAPRPQLRDMVQRHGPEELIRCTTSGENALVADTQINVHAGHLMQAASAVAEKLEQAAKPPTGVFPPPVMSSPADAAANAVAASMQAKVAAMSAELAPTGPQIQGAASYAASALTAADQENAARLAGVGGQAQATSPVPQGGAPGNSAGKHRAHIQAVDNKTGGDDEDGKGGGKSWSKGKGSSTHIRPHGEPEKQWGHPTDPHEAWPDVPQKTGTFDGEHGKWEWHGPGRQGGADASQTTDGITGKAGVDAWGVKGEGSWSREAFGHPLDTSATGEIGAHAGTDGTLTKHGVSLGADAFAGGEIGAKGDYHLGPVDLSLGGAAQLGAGGSAHLDLGMEDGKLVFGGTLGAALGPGAKISPHIAVDPKAVLGGLQKAEQWLDGLFK